MNRRALQVAVAIGGLVPVGAGLAGIVFGIGLFNADSVGSLDSHYRYLSGLLLAVGLAFWSTIPAIATMTQRFRLLTAIVVVGGLARLGAILVLGAPSRAVWAALAMELGVTPALCLWQSHVAKTG